MIFPDIFTLTITSEDIQHGIRGHCGRCPFALALIRRFFQGAGGGNFRVDVGPSSAHLVDFKNMTSATYNISSKGEDFIWRFDHLRSVSADSFILEKRK